MGDGSRYPLTYVRRGVYAAMFSPSSPDPKVGGFPAASMKAKYTVANAEGREFLPQPADADVQQVAAVRRLKVQADRRV